MLVTCGTEKNRGVEEVIVKMRARLCKYHDSIKTTLALKSSSDCPGLVTAFADIICAHLVRDGAF